MDYIGVLRGSIRAEAFKKLACLSLQSPELFGSDLERLLQCVGPVVGLCGSIMSRHEYDALIALCDGCVSLPAELNISQETCLLLLEKLVMHAVEIPRQRFSTPIFDCARNHAPWDLLCQKITISLVKISENQMLEIDRALDCLELLLDLIFTESLEFSHYFTLLGLIKGLQACPHFLHKSARAFRLLETMNEHIDTPQFLGAIEDYAAKAYSSNPSNVYDIIMDYDYVFDFSPILFLKEIGLLMCKVAQSLCGSEPGPLLTRLVRLAIDGTNKESVEVPKPESETKARTLSDFELEIMGFLARLAMNKLEFLDRGEAYIVYSSHNRLKVGYLAKSYYVQTILYGIHTGKLEKEVGRMLFKISIQMTSVMMDPDLGLAILQLGTMLVFSDELLGALLTRSLTSLVSHPDLDVNYCQAASRSVGIATKVMSQDAVVTTIYALTNLINSSEESSHAYRKSSLRRGNTVSSSRSEALSVMSRALQSALSTTDKSVRNGVGIGNGDFNGSGETENSRICENVVVAIAQLSQACEDNTVVTLTLNLLCQKAIKMENKFGNLLLKGIIQIAPFAPEREYIVLLRLLNKLVVEAFAAKKELWLQSLTEARNSLAFAIKDQKTLYQVHLHEIMQAIVNGGDVQLLEHHRLHEEIIAIAEQIGLHLSCLAALLPDPRKAEPPLLIKNVETIHLFRNVWFNLVIHGYCIGSKILETNRVALERIAYNSPPLVSERSWGRTETLLELNAILRRGTSNTNTRDQKAVLNDIFEVRRTMSYSKLMFLAATNLVETLRVQSGTCATVFEYFSDPSIKTSGVEKPLSKVSTSIVNKFISKVLAGPKMHFTAESTSAQFTIMLNLCCHRVESLQEASMQCCDLIVSKLPYVLCHKRSLYALFDLLTVLFDSLVDADENEYNPTWSYVTDKTQLSVELPASNRWRSATFTSMLEKAKTWVKIVLQLAPIDVKSMILSYASDVSGIGASLQKIRYGVSFALEMAGKVLQSDHELRHVSQYPIAKLNTLPSIVSQLSWRRGLSAGPASVSTKGRQLDFDRIRTDVSKIGESVAHGIRPSEAFVTDLFASISSEAMSLGQTNLELYRYLVQIPFLVFSLSVMSGAIKVWLIIMKEIVGLTPLIMTELVKAWEILIRSGQGLFDRSHDMREFEFSAMQYAPSDYVAIKKLSRLVNATIEPHLQLIQLFSSSFQASLGQSDHMLNLFSRFVEVGLRHMCKASLHPLARYTRLSLCKFGFDLLQVHGMFNSLRAEALSELILDSSLLWFERRFVYPYGANMLKTRADFELLKDIARLTKNLKVSSTSTHSSRINEKKKILAAFYEHEISTLDVWLHPLSLLESKLSTNISSRMLEHCYTIDPALAINLAIRFKMPDYEAKLHELLRKDPVPAMKYPDAVLFFVGSHDHVEPTHHLLFWAPVSPIDCITLFLPPYGNNPYVIQYTMRSLEYHDVETTFFFVPQIVQCLRSDESGYVERFIIETAKVSQLFAHQIIWNMLANSYKDEDSLEPDSIKHILDKIQDKMTSAFSEGDLAAYEKEFGFFDEVTSISGKLKPYIKKTKAEKKVKIDEEMQKIQIKPGVYLPTNPNGTVIDIKRNSGKPLQSHAKAPFMATFKIKSDAESVDEDGHTTNFSVERWQLCIFKVGDDCRQDVLALQLISIFRSIWAHAGLDLYVYPYRVVASAPGCGVIEVLPNSVSRDMLGREAVNGLHEYFTTKFGLESSIEYQRARSNLAKSLAAYSIILWLLQFKDRHNGNIMYDDQGHILHIDFGFCFDIVPGGVRFEAAPFKFTKEMVMVLGGKCDTEAFQCFEELCVKGFLACRPHMEAIVRSVSPMLESGLPCFKPSTIKNLRLRFVPHKSEEEAGHFMRGLIKNSMASYFTKGYDEFQRLTNGIPY